MEQNRDVVGLDPPILFVTKVLPIAEALADFLRLATMYLKGTATERPPGVGNGAEPPPPPPKLHQRAEVNLGPLIRDKEYTPLEASKILKVAVVTIRKRMGRDEIQYIKRGTRCFILGQEILDLMIKAGIGTAEDSALTQ